METSAFTWQQIDEVASLNALLPNAQFFDVSPAAKRNEYVLGPICPGQSSNLLVVPNTATALLQRLAPALIEPTAREHLLVL